MQARHLDLIDRAFIGMAEGRCDRVMLTMPPLHGKGGRRASRWAPLWYLRRNPGHHMMVASYSADLADDHGRWIRDAILAWGDDLGLQLKPGSQAVNRFDIVGGEGGLLAAGLVGGLTGRGAHIAIVDDPVKDMADADSPTMRRRAWDWWTSIIQTRPVPYA